jgi:predicted DCC family thiol-disulfide oxidoreductase YuxK
LGKTIIYDSSCSLCNKAVKFLDSGKTASQFNFLPASDSAADSLMGSYQLQPGIKDKTVIFIENNHVYTKSTAIIRALQSKGGLNRLAVVLFIIPRFIRDRVYDYVATLRLRSG